VPGARASCATSTSRARDHTAFVAAAPLCEEGEGVGEGDRGKLARRQNRTRISFSSRSSVVRASESLSACQLFEIFMARRPLSRARTRRARICPELRSLTACFAPPLEAHHPREAPPRWRPRSPPRATRASATTSTAVSPRRPRRGWRPPAACTATPSRAVPARWGTSPCLYPIRWLSPHPPHPPQPPSLPFPAAPALPRGVSVSIVR
jgi:hypothetical protein